jgi:PAS domain-containing protein
MTELPDRHDDSWYRDRWDELMELFSASEPEALMTQLRALHTAWSRPPFSRIEDAREALDRLDAPRTDLPDDTAAPAATDAPSRDTYEQLQALLAREDKLHRALGVSSTDAVIQMVNDLTDQLDVLYAGRDAGASSDPVPPSSTNNNTRFERIEAELGVSTPEAVIAMVRSLSNQLDELYAERERLSDHHGVDDLSHTLTLIESMEEQLVALYEERQQQTGDAPLLPPHTLRRLDTMDADALDAVPAGALCLDEEGIIRRANAAALQWPGLSADSPDALKGRSFASSAAPGSAEAVDRPPPSPDGAHNTRFLYTYAGTNAPTTLRIHLHSPPDRSVRWILFRPT